MIKNREIAEKISALMLQLGAEIDNSIALVKGNCTEEEFVTYRKGAGKVMADILLEIMNPIYDVHPDLKPRELE
jgi:hypothetical protein